MLNVSSLYISFFELMPQMYKKLAVAMRLQLFFSEIMNNVSVAVVIISFYNPVSCWHVSGQSIEVLNGQHYFPSHGLRLLWLIIRKKEGESCKVL